MNINNKQNMVRHKGHQSFKALVYATGLVLSVIFVLAFPKLTFANNILMEMVTVSGSTGTGQDPTDSSWTAPTGAALNKTFHFCSFETDVGDSRHHFMFRASELTGIDTLTFHAGAGTNDSSDYVCHILYFTPTSDLVVQRGSMATTATTNNYTLSPVLSATNRSFVIPHGEEEETDTTIGSEEVFEYQLTGTGVNGLQVLVSAVNNSTNLVHFEVVDWGNTDITVQHVNNNSMTTLETTDQVDITAVTQSKTWLIGTVTWAALGATGSPTDDAACRIDFVDSDTVQLRKANSGLGIEWSVQVIEDTSSQGIWEVQHAEINMSTAETSDTATITAVDVNRTMALGTTFMNYSYTGEGSDTSLDNVDTVISTVELTDSTTITATRGVTDTTTLDIHVQAITVRGPLKGAVMVVD